MRLLLQESGNNQADSAPEENVGKYVGIALGVAGGVILLVGVLVFIHRRYGTPLRQCCLGGIPPERKTLVFLDLAAVQAEPKSRPGSARPRPTSATGAPRPTSAPSPSPPRPPSAARPPLASLTLSTAHADPLPSTPGSISSPKGAGRAYSATITAALSGRPETPAAGGAANDLAAGPQGSATMVLPAPLESRGSNTARATPRGGGGGGGGASGGPAGGSSRVGTPTAGAAPGDTGPGSPFDPHRTRRNPAYSPSGAGAEAAPGAEGVAGAGAGVYPPALVACGSVTGGSMARAAVQLQQQRAWQQQQDAEPKQQQQHSSDGHQQLERSLVSGVRAEGGGGLEGGGSCSSSAHGAGWQALAAAAAGVDGEGGAGEAGPSERPTRASVNARGGAGVGVLSKSRPPSAGSAADRGQELGPRPSTGSSTASGRNTAGAVGVGGIGAGGGGRLTSGGRADGSAGAAGLGAWAAAGAGAGAKEVPGTPPRAPAGGRSRPASAGGPEGRGPGGGVGSPGLGDRRTGQGYRVSGGVTGAGAGPPRSSRTSAATVRKSFAGAGGPDDDASHGGSPASSQFHSFSQSHTGDEGGAGVGGGVSHTPQQQLQALHQHWQQQQQNARQSPNGPSTGPGHGGLITAAHAADPRVGGSPAGRRSEGAPLAPPPQALAHQPRSRLAAGGVGLGVDTAVGGGAEGLGDVLRLEPEGREGGGGGGASTAGDGDGGQRQQQQQGGVGQGAGGATSPTAVAWAAAVSLGRGLLSLGGGSRREERSAGQ